MTLSPQKNWKTLSIFFPHPEFSFVLRHGDVEQSSVFLSCIGFGCKAKGVVGYVKSI